MDPERVECPSCIWRGLCVQRRWAVVGLADECLWLRYWCLVAAVKADVDVSATFAVADMAFSAYGVPFIALYASYSYQGLADTMAVIMGLLFCMLTVNYAPASQTSRSHFGSKSPLAF